MSQNMSAAGAAVVPTAQNPETTIQFLFSFYGRTRRTIYALTILTIIVINILSLFGPVLLGQENLVSPEVGIGIFIAVSLITAIPQLALTVRRFHDQNLSGFLFLIAIIPYIGAFIVLFMCLFMPGTKGDNHYGPDPRSR